MQAASRRLKIFDILQKQKTVEVKDLAQEFNVSTMTIRRDLARLENEEVLSTHYGGATLNEGVSSEPSFSIKSGYSQKHKEQIAHQAYLLIEEGDCIYLDCGTTALELAKLLSNKRITLLTNSWKVLSVVHDFSKIEVILAPGSYDPISEGTISAATIDYFNNFLVDKAFVSTQGVDLDYGVSVPNAQDAQVKKSILKISKQKILLADHTKFGQTYFANHGKLEDFDAIIVDANLDINVEKQMRARKLNLFIAKNNK